MLGLKPCTNHVHFETQAALILRHQGVPDVPVSTPLKAAVLHHEAASENPCVGVLSIASYLCSNCRVSSAIHTKTGAWEISQGRRAWGAAKLDRTRLQYPWMRCRWGSPNLLPDASCQTTSEIGSLQTITFSPWMLAMTNTINMRDIWWPHPPAVKDLFYCSLVVRLDLTETRRRKEICQKVENFQPIKNGVKVELVTHPVFTAQTDQDCVTTIGDGGSQVFDSNSSVSVTSFKSLYWRLWSR